MNKRRSRLINKLENKGYAHEWSKWELVKDLMETISFEVTLKAVLPQVRESNVVVDASKELELYFKKIEKYLRSKTLAEVEMIQEAIGQSDWDFFEKGSMHSFGAFDVLDDNEWLEVSYPMYSSAKDYRDLDYNEFINFAEELIKG